MATQRYDIIIFGASGFTGQFVVEEVARIADEEGSLTWAIAGRTMAKLQKVLEAASRKTGSVEFTFGTSTIQPYTYLSTL